MSMAGCHLVEAEILAFPQIHFACRPAVVAGIAEPVTPRRLVAVEGRAVAVGPDVGGEFARHHAGASGGTDGAARVSIAETDSAGGQPVEVRRFYDGVSIEAEGRGSVLVRTDKQNVRLIACGA